MSKKKKVRAEFRKNRTQRARAGDWTREFERHGFTDEDPDQVERVSGKGELARKRTVEAVETDEPAGLGSGLVLDVDESACLKGRVVAIHGLASDVETSEGTVYRCATRRLLKTLSTDERHVVAVGDHVLVRPAGAGEGIIERVEPRRGVLCRETRGRKQILVANVDQVLVVASADEPPLKPNLIDRFLITAERAGIQPVICINKIDLVDPAELMPMAGVYAQLGYAVLLTSSVRGDGVERVRRMLAGRETVVSGQSGVGKSSLLNAIEPGLELKVGGISEESQKGRHTTTSAKLIRLESGGYVVDTPGLRQFALWDVAPAEVAGFFRDIRPFVNGCRFPSCTHTHEEACAVKDAVADELIDARRYDSYCALLWGGPH